MLRAIALMTLILAPRGLLADCGADCGTPGGACCNCVFQPLADLCVFDVGARWCGAGSLCDGRVCVAIPPPVTDSSGCGVPDAECCPDPVAPACGPGLLCASGTCVLEDGVLDSSACGLDGAPCCGAFQDCDEDLVCVDGTCMSG
jgi:hypothetical protein